VRALVTTEKGGPEVLRIEERPDLAPGPGDVRVAVRAAGVNFADLMARQGLYPDAPKLPAVVGYEFAGVVDAAGEGVEGTAVGDRVLGGSRFGGYAEQVVTGAGNVMALPEDWSFEEGAALPVNYGTAYAGLVRYGSVQDGERILVHAAAGGVGIAATQIAGVLGAEVFGTASAGKHDAVRGFGVAHPIDYRSKDFVREVRRLAGEKRPLDLVMDAVGGNSFRKSFSLLRAGGRLVCFGASSAVTGDTRSIPTAIKSLVQTPVFHPLSPAVELAIGHRAEHPPAVGREGLPRRVHGPARGLGPRRPRPSGGGRGLSTRTRGRRPPLPGRGPQRREGRPHLVA